MLRIDYKVIKDETLNIMIAGRDTVLLIMQSELVVALMDLADCRDAYVRYIHALATPRSYAPPSRRNCRDVTGRPSSCSGRSEGYEIYEGRYQWCVYSPSLS